MQNNNEIKLCPNCEKDAGSGKYCQECGQKNTPLKLNLITLFGDFFSIVFNLDNKFFRTLRAAFVPAKLANAFIQGKRKLYLHPFRFFFYAWLLLALAITTGFGSENSAKIEISEGLKKDSINVNSVNNDDFHIKVRDNNYLFTSDSTKYLKETQDTIVILYQDLESLEEKELFEKYNINSWIEKLVVKKVGDFKSDAPKMIVSILTFLQQNMIWLFLFVMPFSAIGLALLFWRSKKYYSEHILYLMYLFSVLFIIMAIFVFLGQIVDYTPIVAFLLLSLVLFYIYFSFRSMKKFYQRSTRSTLWKWIVYLWGNVFLFLIGSLFYLVLSFLLS